jgi:uncharacterized phage protein gp47/JayE
MKSVLDPLDTSFRGVVDRLLDALGQGTDNNAGSILRTLVEAYAREMATFYAMLDLAHRAGYLESAEGAALDSVVAVLGIDRARAGRLTGKIELGRISPAPQDIGVPAGFRVTGALPDGSLLPLFETAEDVTLARGTTRVTVEIAEVRDPAAPAPDNPVPFLNPNTLTIMPRPALGIESVQNIDPITRSSADETDEHLRARARLALRQSQRGTLEAIVAAVSEQGITRVEVREPEVGPPGVVLVLIGDPGFEQDLLAQERVRRAIRATKAAGVRAVVQFVRTVYLQPTIVLAPTDPELDDRGFDRLRGELRIALAKFVADLPSEQNVSRRKLEAILFGHPGVQDIKDLKLASFTLGPDERYPLDPARQRVITSGRGVTDETGDVIVRAFERPSLDLDRWPPIIARDRTPLLQLDLVVRAAQTDKTTLEAVRTVLNGFATRLPEIENKNQKPIVGELLTLIQPAGATAILLAVITDHTGAARILGGEARLDSLPEGVRLVLGGVDLGKESP